MESQEARNVFARSWELLRTHPIIIVPSIVAGLLAAATTVYFDPHGDPTGTTATSAADAFGKFLWWFIAVAGAVVAVTYTTGMAEALWQSGATTFGDGWAALKRDFVAASLAMVILMLVAAGAALLGPPTLFLSILAFAYLTAYVMPAVIVGDLDPFKAFNESFNLAWNYPVNTAVMIVGVAFVWLMAALCNTLLETLLPIAGPLVADLLGDAVVAFATLVFVGEYITIRRVKPRAVSK
jgi:hypothetical protein